MKKFVILKNSTIFHNFNRFCCCFFLFLAMKINASIRVCWAHSRRVRALHKHPDQDKPQAYWKPWQCPKAKQIALKTQTKPEKKHNNLLAQVAPSIRIWFDGEPILSPLYATSHALRTTLKWQFILRATNQLCRERKKDFLPVIVVAIVHMSRFSGGRVNSGSFDERERRDWNAANGKVVDSK